jgi:glyoxylase-like metal-dependent hydrolase (beta-lactamase superfamily II)
MTNRLQWDVLVSAQIPVVTSDLPPGASEMKWSPISSTLISGERDAVLVDTAITVDQNQKLVDWIAHSGKNLTAIYATHGHGDHFFGVNTIQEKFPKARFVATSEVIAVMRKQASVPVVESYWKPRFPGQIDSTLLIADELKDRVLELEGNQLISVSLGHTDTDSTTCLHVPSIGLAVCGDALYNDVHLHLGESNAEGRNEWIAALDTIESLKPVAAIAGHKRPGAPDTPDNIEATRKYIRDFDRIASHTKTAVDSMTRKTNNTRKGIVGTVKKSTATISPMWFFKNVLQVCDGGRLTVCRTRDTVRSDTAIPSLSSSP